MSRVYVPVANVGKAHAADIYSLSITPLHTITASGDGYLKLWPNKRLLHDKAPQLKESSVSVFVDPSGLHHVDAFYSIEGHGIGLVYLIATVSFSGRVRFYRYREDNGSDGSGSNTGKLELLESLSKSMGVEFEQKSFWGCKWVKSDDQVVSHRFVACDVKGSTYVWRFHTFESDEGSDAKVPPGNNNNNNNDDDATREQVVQEKLGFEFQGEVSPSASNRPVFATCIDISPAKGLLATGFANGTVVVSQLSTLRPLYTFEGFGMEGIDQNSNSVRRIKFSPGGNLLAVANDSGSYGCVTLYETEFGERIGNLTVPTHSDQSNIGMFAHNGWVFSLAFNSSGECLATCGYDGKIRVWDVKTKEHLTTLNISANDIEVEEDILLSDENGDSLRVPPVFDIEYVNKGIFNGIGNESNEGLCCVCMDRSIRWYREAGGK